MDSNHYQIVGETLRGQRGADEQTFASLAILSERLDRLKDFGGFSNVSFSPDVKELAKQKITMTV